MKAPQSWGKTSNFWANMSLVSPVMIGYHTPGLNLCNTEVCVWAPSHTSKLWHKCSLHWHMHAHTHTCAHYTHTSTRETFDVDSSCFTNSLISSAEWMGSERLRVTIWMILKQYKYCILISLIFDIMKKTSPCGVWGWGKKVCGSQ